MLAVAPTSLASASRAAFYSVFGLFQPEPGCISRELDGLRFVASLQGVCHIAGKGLNRLHGFSAVHAKAALLQLLIKQWGCASTQGLILKKNQHLRRFGAHPLRLLNNPLANELRHCGSGHFSLQANHAGLRRFGRQGWGDGFLQQRDFLGADKW